jgi:hypothetical protein
MLLHVLRTSLAAVLVICRILQFQAIKWFVVIRHLSIGVNAWQK